MPYLQGRKRNIFQRGQSHFLDFFPGVKCFFPVENSHFGGPKKKFHWFEKTSSSHFVTFPPSIFNFPPSLFRFSFFSAPFSSFSVKNNYQKPGQCTGVARMPCYRVPNDEISYKLAQLCPHHSDYSGFAPGFCVWTTITTGCSRASLHPWIRPCNIAYITGFLVLSCISQVGCLHV